MTGLVPNVGGDDDVMFLGAAGPQARAAERRWGNCTPCFKQQLTKVSYTNLEGKVEVVDLISDDERGDQADEPVAPAPPPFPPVRSSLKSVNDEDDL